MQPGGSTGSPVTTPEPDETSNLPGASAWVAEVKGQVAGYTFLVLPRPPAGGAALLAALYVLAEEEGKRFGYHLFRTAVDACRQAGCRSLHLGVDELNERSR
jgi:GNAT superfamily N-acetyltransferase